MALIITLLLFINVPLTFSRHRQSRNENLIRQGLHSIIVHYPRAIYEGDTDWKHASHKSTTLSRKPTEKYEQIARSQDQEDIMLYENWFYGVSNGIVIEVQLERNYIYCHKITQSGALDGYSLSNSYMFERFANWTSVNIGKSSLSHVISFLGCLQLMLKTEANPSSFFSLKENRPDAINIFAALCSEEKLLHYVDLHGLESRGFIELMSDEFIQKYHPDYFANKSIISDYAAMKCCKFTTIWRMLGLKEAALWILDVEGAELSVLQVLFPLSLRIIIIHTTLRNYMRSGIHYQHMHTACPL
jgi:hypothetical protein